MSTNRARVLKVVSDQKPRVQQSLAIIVKRFNKKILNFSSPLIANNIKSKFNHY